MYVSSFAYRVEIAHPSGSEAFCNFWRSDDGADRVPITHRFRNGHNVGNNIMGLKCPIVSSDTTKADLYLVGDSYATSITDYPKKIYLCYITQNNTG